MENVYAVIFMDAIHDHVRSEGHIVKKAVYIAIGINLDVRKDVLGMWIGENEIATATPQEPRPARLNSLDSKAALLAAARRRSTARA